MTASFPATRLRRNRQFSWLRELSAESRLHPSDLVWPVFVREGEGQAEPVASMPGVHRLSIDLLAKEARRAASLHIPAIALFPVVPAERKSEDAAEAFRDGNLIHRAVKAVKEASPEIGVICDVALDPYTTHGHDGLIQDGYVQNDITVEALCRQAVALSAAGADIVAPSDMMDGRVGAIRAALDRQGMQRTGILSYAAKFASAFYGPFRDAVGSASQLKGDKRSYQMNPANSREALREVELDISEGADMVMIKPGMPYLDVLTRVAERFPVPVLAYQVSGEYAMIRAAGQNGWLNAEAAMLESLLAFKRAGAAAIFTYAALDVAQTL